VAFRTVIKANKTINSTVKLKTRQKISEAKSNGLKVHNVVYIAQQILQSPMDL